MALPFPEASPELPSLERAGRQMRCILHISSTLLGTRLQCCVEKDSAARRGCTGEPAVINHDVSGVQAGVAAGGSVPGRGL